ncbi:MAG: DNA helicase [Planctomycetota bacterium]|nr:MAG: DNA helicase [Planctomycetota bacterium]
MAGPLFDRVLPPEPAATAPGTDSPGPPRDAEAAADPLLADLTPAQREAVTHLDGPMIVVAGPGSGKTRVLTRRVAWLVLRAGVEPWRILAITFTNKAAEEMRARIERLLVAEGAGGAAEGVLVSTFHSFCARMLRRYGPPGRTSDFTIYDTDDQKACLKRVLAELQLDAAQWRPGALLARISEAKNRLLDAEAFAEQAAGWRDEVVARVYRAYEQALAQFNALDFDDLLLKMLALLEREPQVREELRARFRHVLVDEYQDTNRPQYLIANLLAGADGNLFVVGDPDQAIYKWRGADLRNILEFERDHPSAREVRLERNYRSTRAILRAAEGLIEHNRERRARRLFTDNDEGVPLRLVRCLSDEEEARLVADEIAARLEQGGCPARELAVFYRANALSRRFEEELRRRGIPHRVVGAVPFYQRREVKDVLAWLRLLANPDDQQALARVIGLTGNLGAGTLGRLAERAATRGWSVLRTLLEDTAVMEQLRAPQRRALSGLRELLAELRAMPPAPVLPLLQRVLERTGYLEALRGADDPQELARADNVEALLNAAAELDAREPAGGYRALLDQAALWSAVEEDGADGEAVRLMTLHAAKGLEFDEVFIVGFDDRLLPLEREDSACDLEEERRLLYVGLTRARRRVTLTSAMVRRTWGRERTAQPSRFLAELPSEVLERTGTAGLRLAAAPLPQPPPSRSAPPPAAFAARLGELRARAAAVRPGGSTAAELVAGARVRHAVFGEGEVLEVSGSGVGRRVRVRFERIGTKTLVLQYANLERLT